jgi:hypothetical protein
LLTTDDDTGIFSKQHYFYDKQNSEDVDCWKFAYESYENCETRATYLEGNGKPNLPLGDGDTEYNYRHF